MSMSIGTTYIHEGSGATFVCLSIEADNIGDVYTGELTDTRGTRRWVLAGAELPEWKPKAVLPPDDGIIYVTVSQAAVLKKSIAKHWAAMGKNNKGGEEGDPTK